ncbi:uncharacterized protein LALA0_S01e12508g [Lachancea lanzarotensis]|uniref:LALA0S01e12508g1_1 n=1 Tax=Lachancea lanzarotensis TaxID=1245769 RepID=A0A0C7MYF5_9SACH|nr:uncharacterized protein LALA0_S01e12508g [Lachancea lanzarotensis]CEP60507.1 LALA0S01e12508g1_1 [Lachancea lanzarotensis]
MCVCVCVCVCVCIDCIYRKWDSSNGGPLICLERRKSGLTHSTFQLPLRPRMFSRSISMSSSSSSSQNFIRYNRLGNRDETLHPGFEFRKSPLHSHERPGAIECHNDTYDNVGVESYAWQFRGCFDADLTEDSADTGNVTDLEATANTPNSLSPSLTSTFVSGSDVQPSLRPVLDMAGLALERTCPMPDMDNESDLSSYSPAELSLNHNALPLTTSQISTPAVSVIKPEPCVLQLPHKNSKPIKPVNRSCRNVWCEKSDMALLKTMLATQELLHNVFKRRPRSRYWACISESLATKNHMHRNKRQCRDRFNLIYWKAVRDKNQDKPAGNKSELEKLKTEYMGRFFIDKDNNVMLRTPEDGDAGELSIPHEDVKNGETSTADLKNPWHIFASLQKSVVQLTERLDSLHEELNTQREVIRHYEQNHAFNLHEQQQQQQQQLPSQSHPELSLRSDYDRYAGDQGIANSIRW